MPLDARVEAQKLREMYLNDPRQQSFNLLLLGEKGVGKTKLLQTARKPVHVDSFENGGTLTLRKGILAGDIIVDTRYENEDPWKPTTYVKWKTQFQWKLDQDYFTSIGTYAIDSCSAWSDAIMWYLLAEAKAPGTSPVWQRDYKPQRTLIANHMEQLLQLPCDFILTGHLKPRYEKQRMGTEVVDTQVAWEMATTGQGMVDIPRKFSEMWIMQCKDTTIKDEKGEFKRSKKYSLLTSRKEMWIASTRIGDGGKLLQEEEPDIKKILKKCGLEWKDKAPLFDPPKIHNPVNSVKPVAQVRGK